MVAAGNAGGAHAGDLLSLVDVLTHGDYQRAVVAVVGDVAVAVVDLHQIAIAAHPAGVDHRAAVGGIDRRTVAVGDVNGLVVGAGAADTGVAPSEIGGDDAVAGPAEAAGGIPGGTLLGAAELLLRHRLG